MTQPQQQPHNIAGAGAMYLAQTDLLGAAFRSETGEPEQPQTGNEDGQQ